MTAREGKIKNIGLSECCAKGMNFLYQFLGSLFNMPFFIADLRRAHKVHPIAALQVEYSPFHLEIETEKVGLKEAARELGITVVAYSPLGRGLLTGQVVRLSHGPLLYR